MADQWLTAVQGTVGTCRLCGRSITLKGDFWQDSDGVIDCTMGRCHSVSGESSMPLRLRVPAIIQPEGASMSEPILGDQPASQSGGTVYYLASRYSRYAEMQGVRDTLEVFGHKVTSRWIDLHGGTQERSYTVEELNNGAEQCAELAIHDYEDIQAADAVASFTCGSGGKGGRHVEFGMAVALGKRLIVVGPREHVFHTLPQVEWYPNWSRWVMALTRSSQLGRPVTSTNPKEQA